MTKLEKLYKSIQTLKELGATLPEELIAQTNKLEEEIIKNEILPVATEKIEPILSQIQRELVLVVNYMPNEPLSVRISRKRNITSEPETIEITPDPKAEHTVGKKKYTSSPKSTRTNLRVTLPDGKMIENRFAYETLQEVVLMAGPEKVRALGIIQNGVPLVSTTVDNFYIQKDLGNGLYLITHSSTIQKQKQIRAISEAFDLGLKVEII